jgi:hypothetical protein
VVDKYSNCWENGGLAPARADPTHGRQLNHAQKRSHNIGNHSVENRRYHDPDHRIRNQHGWNDEEHPDLRREVVDVGLHILLLMEKYATTAKKVSTPKSFNSIKFQLH